MQFGRMALSISCHHLDVNTIKISSIRRLAERGFFVAVIEYQDLLQHIVRSEMTYLFVSGTIILRGALAPRENSG